MENTDSMQNPVMPVTPAPAPVQKPQKTLLIVAGLVVVAALAAGGVWAYNRYAEPAEKKIFTAVEKMAEANSFTYAGTIHVFPSESSAYNNYLDLAASQTGGRASKEFDLSFNGAWEGKTKENKKDS